MRKLLPLLLLVLFTAPVSADNDWQDLQHYEWDAWAETQAPGLVYDIKTVKRCWIDGQFVEEIVNWYEHEAHPNHEVEEAFDAVKAPPADLIYLVRMEIWDDSRSVRYYRGKSLAVRDGNGDRDKQADTSTIHVIAEAEEEQ